MTLSASAIINGLTMLRAYGASGGICWDGGIRAPGPEPKAMHSDDASRLESEGWVYDPRDPSHPFYPSTHPWFLESEE
jgi:hypothetical protein